MKFLTIQNPIRTDRKIQMAARYENTRSGFRHLAETDDGIKAKCTYLNRTWEVYTYQSVFHELAHNWIVANTGWNPRTKRDGQKFKEMYDKMCKEMDEAQR